MTSLGGAPSPCTFGLWWGVEGTELPAFALGCWLCWALGDGSSWLRGPPTTCARSRRLDLQAGDRGSGLLGPLFIQYILNLEAAQATAQCEYQLKECSPPPPGPGPGALQAVWEGRVARRGRAGCRGPLPQDQIDEALA